MVREGRGRRVVSAVAIFLTAVALQQACTVAGHTRPPRAARATSYRWWDCRASTLRPIRQGPTAVGGQNTEALTLCTARRASVRASVSSGARIRACSWRSGWRILSVLLQTLRVPRSRVLQAGVPAVVAGLVAVAVYSMLVGASEALAVLAPLEVRFSGRGFALAVVAILLSVVSALMLLTSFVPGARAGAADGSQVCARGRRMSGIARRLHAVCSAALRDGRRASANRPRAPHRRDASQSPASARSNRRRRRPRDRRRSSRRSRCRPTRGLADQRAFETLPLPVREVLDVRRELQPQGEIPTSRAFRSATRRMGAGGSVCRESCTALGLVVFTRATRAGTLARVEFVPATPRRFAARLHVGRRRRCDGGDGVATGFD